jgi:hypothetical protein
MEEKIVLNVTLKKSHFPDIQSDNIILHPISKEELVFNGDLENPFLAPRGVFTVNNMLFVTDTGQNRVFGWKNIPSTPFEKPDYVLGQLNTMDTSRNSGDKLSASTLLYPSGIWSDGEKIVVADAWNHRVLIWHTLPTKFGQPADVVIGQPNFNSNHPNINGIGHPPSAQSLNWPYGVFVYKGKLFIADTGNRRVLVYNTLPNTNFVKADMVIGKASFDDRDYEHTDAIWPYSVKISQNGSLIITDTQYYRVLFWNNWNDAINFKADHVLGQPDLHSCGQNQFGLYPQANTLSWCYDAMFYKSGIFIADTGNSRVLWHHSIPSKSGMPANNLIGKSNFFMGSENSMTVFGTDKSIYWPFSICADENSSLLAIADTGNHRILFHKLKV